MSIKSFVLLQALAALVYESSTDPSLMATQAAVVDIGTYTTG